MSYKTIATDDRGVYLSSLSVSLSRGLNLLHCAKMAERIDILFRVNTLGGPIRNIVLDGDPDPPIATGCWGKI